MPKFSIIIPVYNTSKYLTKCLDSVFNQSYKDYEVIVVNDGSTDNSKDILDNYENIIVINQENQGLSMARNNGIKASTGEYFLLLDSDDYIEKDLLLKLSENLSNSPDLVRFQVNEIKNDIKKEFNEKPFYDLKGTLAFHEIVQYHYVENAWAYLYKTEFFKENKFEFKKDMYHEDYGLIPYIIIKANKVNSISYLGYNYVQREGSIMNSGKLKKKADDILTQYLDIIDKSDDKIYKSFLANSVITTSKKLKGKDYKEYLEKIKRYKVVDNILDDTLSRKLKKMIIKINPKIYYKG